jgi:hypothetical protein
MGAEIAAISAVEATIANAIKASGVVVRVEPVDFARILGKAERPLVVYAQGGFFSTSHQYLISYKGLAFFTKSSDQIVLPRGTELIRAKKIWIPG